MTRPITRFAVASFLAVLASAAAAQEQPGPRPGGPPPGSPERPPQGGGREQMWPAATAEEWKKPVLITFQRTWEDAVAVSKETGKPILVCVNMDGEIASEHYAGVRYRQPEIAALYEPYVCVIASVYRHTPKDYDDQGQRVLCPRFGSVTCGEHIAIEPIVYEKFLDEKRIAPRHIMVEVDGSEKYDVYYANDTASVFQTIRDGIAQRKATPPTVVRGDRPVVERVASPDVKDREVVEATYAKGDAQQRRALLEAAAAQGAHAPVELLRQAIFGLDTDLSQAARKTLAQAESPAATDLIVEALRVPMDATERDALIAALGRIGKTSRRAQWLAVVHQGLAGRSNDIDLEKWSKTVEGGGSPAPESDWGTLEEQLQSRYEARRASPADAAACLDFAEASVALAVQAPKSLADDPKAARAFSRLAFEDARRAAAQAEKMGATGWRVDSLLTIAYFYGGNADEAYARAEKAMKSMPADDPGWNAMAVLTIFAESRWKAIQKAVREKKEWPPSWLTDVNAAYSVLRKHPLGTDAQVAWHYDFLTWLGAFHPSSRVLFEGVTRFPNSTALHERLRTRALRDRGPEGLEAVYDQLLKEKGAPAALERYAGSAAFVAAEFHRRGNAAEKAAAAYDRAAAHFERLLEADARARTWVDSQVALVHAARSRMAYEQGDDERSLKEILASFERSPATAGTLDGLSLTPASTAQMLLARLLEKKSDDAAARLREAMSKLDPVLLVPKNE
jgi:hypothetical protein